MIITIIIMTSDELDFFIVSSCLPPHQYSHTVCLVCSHSMNLLQYLVCVWVCSPPPPEGNLWCSPARLCDSTETFFCPHHDVLKWYTSSTGAVDTVNYFLPSVAVAGFESDQCLRRRVCVDSVRIRTRVACTQYMVLCTLVWIVYWSVF